MRQKLQFNKVIKIIILAGDFCIYNAIFIILYHQMGIQYTEGPFTDSLSLLLVILNLCYFICCLCNSVILHHRIIRAEQIIVASLRYTMLFALLFTCALTFSKIGNLSVHFFVLFYAISAVVQATYRVTFKHVIGYYRKRGGNSRTTIFIGSGQSMTKLYSEMSSDLTLGFRILGYFDDAPSTGYPSLPYLGRIDDVIPFLKKGGVEQVYSELSTAYSTQVPPIIYYCENHLIHFFSIPNICTYLKRSVCFELLGNTPVASIRREPLSLLENRLIKRAFDIGFSALFLCTLFPLIYIVVGIIIKTTSPGPILFRQQRNGEDGRTFWCYKFRSMKVNKESDTLQATLNDPRKTRFGTFLRHSSIDEMPQFINVLLGDMSVVGPRPHMLKHTQEYSELINRYMVRHFIKPGITGWAQVTGFRGETRELWQMEGRVEQDIWYLEHWTFTLDLYIIYKTVRNALQGEVHA